MTGGSGGDRRRPGSPPSDEPHETAPVARWPTWAAAAAGRLQGCRCRPGARHHALDAAAQLPRRDWLLELRHAEVVEALVGLGGECAAREEDHALGLIGCD